MKNATLRQLKTFETVARRLSFARAADELNLSPPAVSTQIKHLEEHAGVPLFEQFGKRIFLTPAGHEMLQFSRAIIDRFREAEETLAQMRGVAGGSLNIGVVSAGGYFAPGLLAEFLRRNEGVKLELAVENRETLLKQLDDNRIDLAMMVGTPADCGIVSTTFAHHPFVIVASPTHPLVGQKRIPMSALSGERFIIRERGSDTWDAMEQGAIDRFVRRDESIEISNTETIKQAVMAGMGISFLSAYTIGLERRAGMLAVLDVVDFPLVRQWRIAHRAEKRLAPVAEAFRLFLIDEGATQIAQLTNLDSL
ncbi:LysR family transcriptional regulator [Pararobbsia alpina]|uniref:HTH-type transcriptional activator CmpR n=1 Tax=Pararobbsia alpina TaxID=621374 RepID=A0A6S7D042_9BURK|nr:LysR family transcriptional regulator [Pararobbsia alpina]CAB3802404.1 HTH-type transcriptional activator CmpR [Pararobbsia alpina]